ncbi:hypothetical protein IM40_03735 [Candidatus Paracaedimonas acanthamoebae]|nr:hypothetical protein IM40_03735 [Candidatus Paracaedimonas acanthamoebae]
MFHQNKIFPLDPKKFEIKELTSQEPIIPLQPESRQSIDEKRNLNNPKPIDGQEPQDRRKKTSILEDIPNPNPNKNPRDNWDENHPIHPLID